MENKSNQKLTYLPSCGVVTKVAKRVLEPGVNLVERQLSFWGLNNGLYTKIMLIIFKTELVSSHSFTLIF